jgi:hypothetical protein
VEQFQCQLDLWVWCPLSAELRDVPRSVFNVVVRHTQIIG